MTDSAKSTLLPKVSYSWKNQIEWCARQYKYARVSRVAPDSPKHVSTITGIAIHRVVELMYKKREFSIGYVRGSWPLVFDNIFLREKFVFSSPLNRQRVYDKGLTILEKTYRMAEEKKMLVEPIAAEWKFKLEVKSKLGRRFIILGKIDLIIKIGNEIWVIDLKTGSYKVTEQELAKHDQLTIYSLAVKKLLNIESPKLAFWYPVHRKIFDTKRTERDHEKLINEIENDQFKIERGEFEPTYKRCHLCQFRDRCRGEDLVKKTGAQLAWFYKGSKR